VLLRVLLDAGLKLGPEVPDEALDGPRERLAQRADGVSLDLLGQLQEHVDLALARLAALQALHDLRGPLAALAAGGALSAALVLVELGQAGDGAHDVGGLVHDDDGGRAETRLGVFERVKVHDLVVADVLREDRGRGATGDHGQQVVPSAADTTAVALDQLAKGDGHLLLDGARVVNVAGDAEELGTRIALTAERGEPARAATHDGRRHRDRLDVGDGAGAAEQTDSGRKWGLQARLAGLALERLDQRGLLTADIRAHSTVDVDVEVVAGAAGVLADQTGLVGLVDRALDDGRFVVELAANVDVGGVGVHRAADDETALDELVGVLAHDLAVLAGARLTLIGIDDQVAGSGILLPVLKVHERLYRTP